MKKGRLYLIPTELGPDTTESVIPKGVRDITINLRYFAVEKIKSARRYLKRLDRDIDIDALTFFELNKRTSPDEIQKIIQPILEGEDGGIISEAGCPGIADPGSSLVKLAHQNDIAVIPLTGPSSMFLALMASGMNGQQYTFHGYLPREKSERKHKIQVIEKAALTTGYTQIFMETPYRNRQLAETVLDTCQPQTKFCIACDLTLPEGFVQCKTVKNWKKLPEIHKRPAVFLIGR